jgi:CheY-like chemotaxis protein
MIPAAPTKYVESKDQAIAREEQGLLAYLHKAGQALVETNRPIHAAVHMGEPADEIIDFARQEGTDLILMATHGRSGLRETLHGSVTAAVVRSGVAPVLMVRPKEDGKSNRSSKPVRVLLIDGHDEARDTLARRLRRDGRLELIGATASLPEAAGLLASADIVLLDVHGRERRGVDTCRAILEVTDAPLVAFTSFMTPELWSEVKQAGAVDYLLKHVDTERLGSELVRLAKRRPARLAGVKA